MPITPSRAKRATIGLVAGLSLSAAAVATSGFGLLDASAGAFPLADGATATADAGDAGSVQVTRDGNVLIVSSSDPATGWTVQVERGIGREVEVDFVNGDQVIRLEVELEDGDVQVSTDDDAVAPGDDPADDDNGDDVNDDHGNRGPGHDGADDNDDDVNDDHGNRGPGHDGADDNDDDGTDDNRGPSANSGPGSGGTTTPSTGSNSGPGSGGTPSGGGADDPVDHDVNDDHGGATGGGGADDPVDHDVNDDHGGDSGSGGGSDDGGSSGHGGDSGSGGGSDDGGSSGHGGGGGDD